jgi:hypothetical protein
MWPFYAIFVRVKSGGCSYEWLYATPAMAQRDIRRSFSVGFFEGYFAVACTLKIENSSWQ